MADPTRRRYLDPDEILHYGHVQPGLLGGVRLIRTNLLPRAADGMTLGRLVLLRHDHQSREPSTLLAHELVHVRQYAELGFVVFAVRYVWEYLRNLVRFRDHHKAYLAISFEEEARREAALWLAESTEGGTETHT
ncbi:MAG: eCIS core domain-containing protein [Acidimicrobiales bacterium]